MLILVEMQVKPASEADLKPWLEKVLPHNPTMVSAFGVQSRVVGVWCGGVHLRCQAHKGHHLPAALQP